MIHALQRALRAGVERGVLPPDTQLPAGSTRPWPVVLLTALGAWLAALPLLGFFGALLGPFMTRAGGAYLVGVLALGVAVLLLRRASLPVFVEQLAVPALLVGLGSLALGLYRDLPYALASVLLLATCGVLAAALPQAWLRTLLGAAAAGLFVALVLGNGQWRFDRAPMLPLWAGLHAALLAWSLALLLLQAGRLPAGVAVVLEPAAAGWLALLLAGLALWSGMAFLVGGSLGGWAELLRDIAPRLRDGSAWRLLQAGSVLLALAAAALAARAWPGLRSGRAGAGALVLLALSFWLPALGGTLLALALAVTTSRWHLAGAAALAAAWIVGSFYYQLDWPLADKALVLAGAGAALAALAWRATPGTPAAAAPRGGPLAPALVGLGAVAALAVANVGIWQKEDLIAHGDKVFLELAPVDPRSLMQGDFMRLNWRLPPDSQGQLRSLLTPRRPHVVAERDARGVARLLRIADADAPLAAGELRIELTPKGGRWQVVTDAWFFREGDGARWSAARYGEFRVAPDGRTLLVGLADAQLRPIADR